MTERDIENKETMIWEGQGSFEDFVIVVRILGYKYVVKCYPLEDEFQDELGAGCRDHEELVETLLFFSYRNYSTRVARVDVVGFEQLN